MIRSIRFAGRAAGLTVLVGAAMIARPAAAQDAGADGPTVPACSGLSNPVYLTGSSAFEGTVKNFAVKFGALTTGAFTVVYSTPGSCVGVDNIVNNKDLMGSAHYYTVDPTDPTKVVINTCALPASGQKPDVGISDVFYDSCAGISPATIPGTLKDFPGPAQAMLFVVPKADTSARYITALEAQDLYGCGATYAGNMSPFVSAADTFCRDPNSGTQITIAKAINIPATVMVPPICVPPPSSNPGTGGLVANLTGSTMAQAAIGFVSEDAYDGQRQNLNSLAFQAFNQTQAYLSDSTAATNDRANVRDGHYTIWGYEHMFAAVDGTGAITNSKAADFIGFINGTKTDASIDPVAIEGAAGTIPICAMKVQRSTDGGPLSYSTVSDTCNCAFTAAATKTTPTSCAACTGTGTSTCTGGLSCHHGYCE
jgi:hypothetical protein